MDINCDFMVSIIITSKNEGKSIGQAIHAFLKQDFHQHTFEIIVVAPDEETLQGAQALGSDLVTTIKDTGVGKVQALNLAISRANGNILIFSDGDVVVGNLAVAALLAKLETGVVSGRPIAEKNSVNKYIFWQNCLFDSAHKMRLRRSAENKFITLSGYLFACKKELLRGFVFPQDILTEDEYLSYYLFNRSIRIAYAPLAKVFVKAPKNYSDWLKQKVRTLGGSYQIPVGWKKNIAMRSFSKESAHVFSLLSNYGKNFRQQYWLQLLFFARLYAWIKAFFLVKILEKNSRSLWIRVISTK